MQLRKLYLPADPAKNRQSFAASLLLSSPLSLFSGFVWAQMSSQGEGDSLYRGGGTWRQGGWRQAPGATTDGARGPGATPLAPGLICNFFYKWGAPGPICNFFFTNGSWRQAPDAIWGGARVPGAIPPWRQVPILSIFNLEYYF
jgi:hypothetical protein